MQIWAEEQVSKQTKPTTPSELIKGSIIEPLINSGGGYQPILFINKVITPQNKSALI